LVIWGHKNLHLNSKPKNVKAVPWCPFKNVFGTFFKDRKVERCFEVNGFGGVNFLEKPCRYLDMDQTMESGEEFIEKNNLIDEKRIEKEQKKMMTQFELSIVRCCSSILDTKVGRCFEVNGFGGIHFIIRPCQLLEVVLEKKRRIGQS
jgi:hypothetical protein